LVEKSADEVTWLFTHVLFPTYVAALLWGGLLLRDARLRAFLPWRDRSQS
jgi:hypothetical protein